MGVKRSVLLWALFVLLIALILFRKKSFANVRAPPKPDAQFYYLNPGEACAEGYNGPIGESLKCQKK
jgi:hypothetical protein